MARHAAVMIEVHGLPLLRVLEKECGNGVFSALAGARAIMDDIHRRLPDATDTDVRNEMQECKACLVALAFYVNEFCPAGKFPSDVDLADYLETVASGLPATDA